MSRSFDSATPFGTLYNRWRPIEQSETTLVTLTARAATKVSKLMAEEPAGEAEVLRIAIQGGGCSGFEYALGFDRGAQAGDHELEFHGVKVVVDPFSAPYLQGSTIDFLEGLQESGFKIDNPNVSLGMWLRATASRSKRAKRPSRRQAAAPAAATLTESPDHRQTSPAAARVPPTASWRVVGSGPAGFYAADALLKSEDRRSRST